MNGQKSRSSLNAAVRELAVGFAAEADNAHPNAADAREPLLMRLAPAGPVLPAGLEDFPVIAMVGVLRPVAAQAPGRLRSHPLRRLYRPYSGCRRCRWPPVALKAFPEPKHPVTPANWWSVPSG